MFTGIFLTLATALGSASCPLPDPRAGAELRFDTVKGYVVTEPDDTLLARFAPVTLVEGYEETFNRVGKPSARLDDKGKEQIFIDPEEPVYYTRIIEWDGGLGHYRNLIYRMHFEKSVANKKSTNGGEGENVGLMLVVTLDDNDHPVFVNAVHTCGCFHALLPTSFTPPEEYPDDWKNTEHDVWGERLPARLDYPETFGKDVRPVVFLRAGSHRVADIQVASIGSVRERYELVETAMEPDDALRHLPLPNGEETSFYYEVGKNKGLVKGAYKRKEAVLLGLFTGDGRVGQDRAYGSEEEVPRGFYTTINPLKKSESDMWDYRNFLVQNGWKP